MLRKFSDHGEALIWGRLQGEKLGVRVWMYTHDGFTWIAGPSSAHLLPGISGDWSPWSGWYFGHSYQAPTPEFLLQGDIEPLPDSGEHWYSLISGTTRGYTHEQKVLLAANIQKNNSCIWHECAALDNNLAECQCGKCGGLRKATNLLDKMTDAEKLELLARLGG